MKDCEGCGEPNSKVNRAHGIRLCGTCLQLDEYFTLCKTEAKKQYFLSDKDLEKCDYIEIKNPNYSGNMYLYTKQDLINQFCLKYNVNSFDIDSIQEMLDELSDKKENAKSKREENLEKKRSKRKKMLVKALKEYDLEFRNDSKLCQGYINGTIKDWDIDDIVERMCQMKFLYEYCHMDKCYKEAIKKRKELRDYGIRSDVPLQDEAEEIALDRYGKKYGKKGKYPKVWPWLK